MLSLSQITTFALVALMMVLTPGPNMIYLISRSLCQGKKAGLISLLGVAFGFVVYMLCAAWGLTALLFALPFAYDAIRILGAVYLLWLAWQAFTSPSHFQFQAQNLAHDSRAKLFGMGFLTSVLNPKIAILYLSLLPQFIRPEQGSVFVQSILLGSIQIMVSVMVNALIVISAGRIASFLSHNPTWANLQKWLMGTVLAGLAVRLLIENKR